MIIETFLLTTREIDVPESIHVPEFDAKTKSREGILLKLLVDPSFIVGLVCLDEFMEPISKPTTMLQGRELEVFEAYLLIDNLMLVSLILPYFLNKMHSTHYTLYLKHKTTYFKNIT